MELKIRQICHPLWQYLTQPVFNAQTESVWNLHRFWYLYKIQLLQNCWSKECDTESKHYL